MPVCCMCHEEKPDDAFAFRSLATGERQSHCRACHAAYRRQHYLDNKASYVAREVARIARFRKQNRVLLYEFLRTHPCIDCGETDPVLLEFDHRDPAKKRQAVAYIAARKPWKFVVAEIEKCDVRCVNCHRRRTAAQFNWSKASPRRDVVDEAEIPVIVELPRPPSENDVRQCSRCGEVRPLTEFSLKNRCTGRRATICRSCTRAYGRLHYQRNKERYLARARKNRKRFRGRNKSRTLEYLDGKSCIDCGESDPVVLEFDHRDGTHKEDNIAQLIVSRQWDKVEAEIKKCDVRCANCHRRRHSAQFGWTRWLLQSDALHAMAS